jgi:hypothetical protein
MFFLFISICPSLFLYTFLPLFSHFYLSPMKNMLGFTQTWRKEISHYLHSPPLLTVLHPRRKNLLVFSCPNLIKLRTLIQLHLNERKELVCVCVCCVHACVEALHLALNNKASKQLNLLYGKCERRLKQDVLQES